MAAFALVGMLAFAAAASVVDVAPVSSALLWRNLQVASLTGHGNPRFLRHETPNAEYRLHRIANRAVKRGLNLDALECYSLAVREQDGTSPVCQHSSAHSVHVSAFADKFGAAAHSSCAYTRL